MYKLSWLTDKQNVVSLKKTDFSNAFANIFYSIFSEKLKKCDLIGFAGSWIVTG